VAGPPPPSPTTTTSTSTQCMHTNTGCMDASDVRRQTADEADRVGGGGERGDYGGLAFIWGNLILVSPSNLIRAHCNPHKCAVYN